MERRRRHATDHRVALVDDAALSQIFLPTSYGVWVHPAGAGRAKVAIADIELRLNPVAVGAEGVRSQAPAR